MRPTECALSLLSIVGVVWAGEAAGQDALRFDSAIEVRGVSVTLPERFALRFGMEIIAIDQDRRGVQAHCGGVTLLRRIGDGPFAVGGGFRVMSGGLRLNGLSENDARFETVAPFVGVSLVKARFYGKPVDALAGVSFARYRMDETAAPGAGQDGGARAFATVAFRVRF